MEASRRPSIPASLNEPTTTRSVTMNAQGRIVLPADIRRQLELQPGDKVNIQVDEQTGEIRLSTWRSKLRWMRAELKARFGDDDFRWSDQLIAERRAEAAREEASLRAYDS